MKLKQKWYRWKERLCFRYVPPFVDRLIQLSTYQARVRLRHAPLDVLIDTNVFAHGVTHETQWVSTGFSTQRNMPLGYLVRVPVHASDCASNLYKSIQYLPGIAHLVRRGFISLKTSMELSAEQYRLSPARLLGGGFYDYSVFRGVHPKSVDASPWSGHTLHDLSDKKQQRARLNASNDPLYQALVALLEPKRSQDAWHIRTAEVNGCFCFLTMDFELLEKVETVKHLEPFLSLKTRLMTPEALGTYLSLFPIPTNVLSYHDASFPVRPDLSQPNNMRIKSPKKRAAQ